VETGDSRATRRTRRRRESQLSLLYVPVTLVPQWSAEGNRNYYVVHSNSGNLRIFYPVACRDERFRFNKLAKCDIKRFVELLEVALEYGNY